MSLLLDEVNAVEEYEMASKTGSPCIYVPLIKCERGDGDCEKCAIGDTSRKFEVEMDTTEPFPPFPVEEDVFTPPGLCGSR